jgi:hypothetical protein
MREQFLERYAESSTHESRLACSPHHTVLNTPFRESSVYLANSHDPAYVFVLAEREFRQAGFELSHRLFAPVLASRDFQQLQLLCPFVLTYEIPIPILRVGLRFCDYFPCGSLGLSLQSPH